MTTRVTHATAFMRYHALACDYDGTIARDGAVDDATVAALDRVRASGRKLLLVSGRELEDLETVLPRLDLFDRAVLENGALLYDPETGAIKALADPPHAGLVHALQQRGVRPLSVGRVIVATWKPHETTVLEVIRDLGLELQVIFNKDAVMVLPSGIDKAIGLRAALAELGLSPSSVVGVGDAENDHAFLAICAHAVAVSNAVPSLKERADWVTAGDHGAGVCELIDELLTDDLRRRSAAAAAREAAVGASKHATGELGPDASFRFRGPEGKPDLRAPNLQVFLELAQGVDDETWMFHLTSGDYARWFRERIEDEEMAQEIEAVADAGFSAAASRLRVREAIARRYPAPD